MPIHGFGNIPVKRMKTYRIEHKPTKTNFLTTDFMDVWNELEKVPDGDTVAITVKEMTVAEFNEELKTVNNGSSET